MEAARNTKGLSQRALAKIVGCSHVFIAEIERGRKLPTAKLLERIQEALKLDDDLVMRHINSRPIQGFSVVGKGSASGGKLRDTLMLMGGKFDELTTREKAVHIVLATGTALRNNGYNACTRLPKVADQIEGRLPSVEVDLGGGRKAVITVAVVSTQT